MVINGTTSLGAAIVQGCVDRGFTTVFTHPEPVADHVVRDIVDSCGGRGSPVAVDREDQSSAVKAAQYVASLGHIDRLIYVPEALRSPGMSAASQELIKAAFDTTVMTLVNFVRVLSRPLAERKGSILVVLEAEAIEGSDAEDLFGVNMSALLGLSKTLARELAPDVRVNALVPPTSDPVLSERIESTRLLDRRASDAEVARTGLDIADWPHATGITLAMELPGRAS